MFIGVPVFAQVSDRKVRITGLSIDGNATGSIGLNGSTATPDVVLPATFQPEPYTNTESKTISLQDSIQVSFVFAAPVSNDVPISVVKSGGTNKTFLASLGNANEVPTPLIEIYVEWH